MAAATLCSCGRATTLTTYPSYLPSSPVYSRVCLLAPFNLQTLSTRSSLLFYTLGLLRPSFLALLSSPAHPLALHLSPPPPQAIGAKEIAVVSTEHAAHFYSKDAAELVAAQVVWHTDADEWSSWNAVGDPVLHIELRNWVSDSDYNSTAPRRTVHRNSACGDVPWCGARAVGGHSGLHVSVVRHRKRGVIAVEHTSA